MKICRFRVIKVTKSTVEDTGEIVLIAEVDNGRHRTSGYYNMIHVYGGSEIIQYDPKVLTDEEGSVVSSAIEFSNQIDWNFSVRNKITVSYYGGSYFVFEQD